MSMDVYVFRGAPASGKGTVVPLFCAEMLQPVTLIEHDAFRWGPHTAGRPVADVSEEEHAESFRAMVAAYAGQVRQGEGVLVIEGLFTYDDEVSSQGNARELRRIAEDSGCAYTGIVLYAAKQVLLARNAARPYCVPADEFDRLYDGVYSRIGADEIVIDSTLLSESETLQLIMERKPKSVA